RSLIHLTLIEKGEYVDFMAKIINSRHTQNSFVSFNSPTYNLLWEKEFYWNVGSFIGFFFITGIVSLIIGIIIKERAFVLFSIYMLTVSVLALYEELLFPVIENQFIFSLLNRMLPLPLAVIATCLNFYIVDYIFGVKNYNTKLLRFLSLSNTICLTLGIVCLVVYMIFMKNLHSGQPMYKIV